VRALVANLALSEPAEALLIAGLFGGAALTGLARLALHSRGEIGRPAWLWIGLGAAAGLLTRFFVAGDSAW
jgi:hypothetical protein